jgi:hypothetical protein
MKSALIIQTGRPGPDKSSLEWREAFGEGLKQRGWAVEVDTSARPCDLLVIWGVRRRDIIAAQKARGGEVCVLERGYLGDRFDQTSVSFGGGLNGRGEFRAPTDDGTRFRERFGDLLKPWKKTGRGIKRGYALIMGQVPGDQSIAGVDIDAFYHQTYKALKKHDFPNIKFRPHPKAGRRGNFVFPEARGTLEEALAGAELVVTYNSNSGVDAVLAGVPVVAMDRGSMVWDIAGHQVTEVLRPFRDGWAHHLAWCQFSKAEFISGFCQEAVGL